jgi:hypothetical protein
VEEGETERERERDCFMDSLGSSIHVFPFACATTFKIWLCESHTKEQIILAANILGQSSVYDVLHASLKTASFQEQKSDKAMMMLICHQLVS